MESFPTKREFTRVPARIEADVMAEGVQVERAETRDVSMNGVFVMADGGPASGQTCEVTLYLGGRPSEYRVQVFGRVARIEGDGFAVEFTGIVGVDSFEHLRNLVLYNAAETESVEDELRSHVGIRRREERADG